jgi:hypothetical protein
MFAESQCTAWNEQLSPCRARGVAAPRSTHELVGSPHSAQRTAPALIKERNDSSSTALPGSSHAKTDAMGARTRLASRSCASCGCCSSIAAASSCSQRKTRSQMLR